MHTHSVWERRVCGETQSTEYLPRDISSWLHKHSQKLEEVFLVSLNDNQDEHQLLECVNQGRIGKFHAERNFNLELMYCQ